MKRKDLIAKINRAFSIAAPNVKDAVLSEVSGQKGKAIIMTNETRKKRSVMKTVSAFAAAAAVFAFALLSGLYYSNNYTTESIISLDVNPSIEISVSKSEKVLGVTAKNKDGELIIGDMDFEGASLDVTVNALIGSMLRNGYLSEIANSILVSVDSKDDGHGRDLQSDVSEMIDTILSSESFSGAVLSQTIEKNDTLSELADEYDITLGKAQLISDIIKTGDLYTFADLVPLTINELNLLLNKSGTAPDHVQTSGEASDKSYIGADMAKEIAAEHAGVALKDARFEAVELDFDDGVMVYEVEFLADGTEHEYEINATTGAIVSFDREGSDSGSKPSGKDETTDKPATDSSELISEDKAKDIAFTHAGVNAADVKGLKVELDRDDGVTVYEIDFRTGDVEYEYDINASTGTIIKSQREQDKSSSADSTDTSASPTLLGKDKAKEIALTHAEVNADSVKGYSCELDSDDGVLTYEIEFFADGYEYEYEVNARTGAIIKSERERDDDEAKAPSEKKEDVASVVTEAAPEADPVVTPAEDPVVTPAAVTEPSVPALIGEAEAKIIALTHASLTDVEVYALRCKLELDDGKDVYEVDFNHGEYEYDYEVDAYSGKILKSDREMNDDVAPAAAGARAVDSTSVITPEEAKILALTHASLTDVEVYSYSSNLDREDGKEVYEIEFRHGEYEYDYEIDAVSGKILKSDRERDD